MNGPKKIPGFNTLPGSSRGTGDVADYQVSASSAAFIKNYDNENPFLMAIGLMNPHDICFWGNSTQVPDDNQFNIPESELPDLPPNLHCNFEGPFNNGHKEFGDMAWRNYRHDYFRMIEKLDADVGRIVGAVDSETDDKHFVLKETGEPSAFIPGKGNLLRDKQPRLLFNLEKDPWEMENLALKPEYKDILEQHELLLLKWEEKLVPGTHFDRN